MPRTLLLADDSVTIQKVVGISFANEDVRLLTVDNGDDALARVRSERPDLVLADVVMPGRSGYEVCEAIKADPELRHIPVLLLSGTFEAFDDERARRAGADGHVTKPFEAQTLVERVNQLLSAAPRPRTAVRERERREVPPPPPPAAGMRTRVLADDLAFGDDDDAFVFDADEEESAAGALTRPSFAVEEGEAPPVAGGGLRQPDAELERALADLGLDEPEEEPRPALRARPDLAVEEPAGPEVTMSHELRGLAGARDPGAARESARPAEPPRTDFDVSASDLGEPRTARRPSPAPAAPPAAAGAPSLPEAVRRELVEALEKIAWEAFGDLTEQLVRQTVARVESVAWEVIPELAERLIREEIRRLREEE
jgi:CheY-like chemotaxis protein